MVSPIKPLTCEKDLGVSITKDLKWNQDVQDISSKANKMLDFVKRTTSGIGTIKEFERYCT
jgi:hypothetical protein